jgi:hypothetical protein
MSSGVRHLLACSVALQPTMLPRDPVTQPFDSMQSQPNIDILTPIILGITNQFYGAEYHSRDHKLCSHSAVSQHFMEPECSLPRSQQLSTCTYPEPHQSRPHLSILYLKCPNNQTPWPLVRERTLPTERPPLVGEI